MNTITSEITLHFADMETGQCGIVIEGLSGHMGKHFIKTGAGVTFLDDGFYYADTNTRYNEHVVRCVKEVTIKC